MSDARNFYLILAVLTPPVSGLLAFIENEPAFLWAIPAAFVLEAVRLIRTKGD